MIKMQEKLTALFIGIRWDGDDDFTKPRMELYRSKWGPSQDAVYLVNLAGAQDEG